MVNTRALVLLVLGLSFVAAGCSNSATATLSPGADLSAVKTFYVVHQPKDTHNSTLLSGTGSSKRDLEQRPDRKWKNPPTRPIRS